MQFFAIVGSHDAGDDAMTREEIKIIKAQQDDLKRAYHANLNLLRQNLELKTEKVERLEHDLLDAQKEIERLKMQVSHLQQSLEHA